TPRNNQYAANTQAQYQSQQQRKLIGLCKDGVKWNGNDDNPAIGHAMIIDASPMSVKVINICIISVERTIFYSGQDGIDILLQFIHVSLLRRLLINQCASAITDIVGGIVRKLKGIGVDLQIFRENVKGQDGIG